MKDTGDKIRKSIAKRQEALEMFRVRREAFLLAKEQINKDIEEARSIWQNTLKQIPNQPFGQ